SVIAVLGIRQDGLVVVDDLTTFEPDAPGTPVDLQEVKAEVARLAQKYHATVVIDSWQSSLMAQELRSQSQVNAIEMPITETLRKRLFQRLLEVVRNNQLRCLKHEHLEKELMGLQIFEKGNGYRIDHQAHGHDDHVFAIGLALLGLDNLVLPDAAVPLHYGTYETDVAGNFLNGDLPGFLL